MATDGVSDFTLPHRMNRWQLFMDKAPPEKIPGHRNEAEVSPAPERPRQTVLEGESNSHTLTTLPCPQAGAVHGSCYLRP